MQKLINSQVALLQNLVASQSDGAGEGEEQAAPADGGDDIDKQLQEAMDIAAKAEAEIAASGDVDGGGAG